MYILMFSTHREKRINNLRARSLFDLIPLMIDSFSFFPSIALCTYTFIAFVATIVSVKSCHRCISTFVFCPCICLIFNQQIARLMEVQIIVSKQGFVCRFVCGFFSLLFRHEKRSSDQDIDGSKNLLRC